MNRSTDDQLDPLAARLEAEDLAERFAAMPERKKQAIRRAMMWLDNTDQVTLPAKLRNALLV